MGAQSSHELNDNFSATNVRAVIFDLGGVVVNSPIKALLDYEASLNLPKGTLWKFLKYDDSHSSCATFERNMITFKEFCRRTDEQWQDFIEENRITETVKFSALDMVVAVDKGQSQPVQEMLVAIDKLRKKGVVTMALTNKWYTCPADQVLPPAQMLPLCTQEEQQLVKLLKKYFDVFVESRVVGWRKRQQEIYDLSMKKIKDSVGVNVKPEECVFLDDIAENLVPFKEMGINTILVQDIGKSIKALESITGYQLH